jgi:predicted Zn-dependent protease
MLLGEPLDALAAYEAALAQRPDEITWRYEFAKLHFEQNHLHDARRELSMVLGQQPNHANAQKLMAEVSHAIARGKEQTQRP